ncbi:MAG: T9SS type A sorting domain-containing protein [Ignavibacteriae bacterium]|nr:T9SS type A sorting domain-containing protein [Ignavibacteriota bacterium]
MRRFFTSTIVQRHFGWLAVAMMMLISVSSLSAQDTRFTDVNGQGEINEGSEYYIGLPNCWRDPSDNVPPGMVPNEAWVSSKVPTMVMLENKSLGINISYAVNPGKHTIIPLPDALMNSRVGIANPYGIRLVGNDPISVIVSSNWRSSGAIYKALPVEMLGKKYAALSLYQDNQGDNRPGQILIVGTKDQTVVRWTLPKAVKSTVESGEGSVTLNEGETYLIQLKMDDKYNQNPQADLTGTIITGSKPIGVITGHTKGAMPRYEGSFYALRTDMIRNMEIEMILPMEIAGTEFMTVPRIVEGRTLNKWPDDNGDMIRLVAVEDNTIISIMRQNGGGLIQKSVPLHPGEFWEFTNMTDPTYYSSNKPVVVGQYLKAWLMHAYEKKDASPLGHVSGGLGEMINVTPLNAWPSYATFLAPKLNNNYVNVTFRTDDVEKIRINGKTFSQFFGSKIQKYQGTDYSYAAKPISAGDYVIEGTDGAKFAAYAYGNWETTEYPTPHNYAYGYPVGANFAIKCDDEIKLVGDPQCGNIKGIAKVGPETSECAGLLYVRLIGKADNYAFSTPKEFVSGDKSTTFTLNVIDPSKPATAVIKAMSRSGRFLTRTYEYTPEQIIATPLSINYGTLGVGETLCRMITLSNPGKIAATVNELKIKLHQKEFVISTSNVFPIIIPPGSSKDVEVCATALEQKSVTIIDTVIAVLGCYEKPITELKVRTEKPKVYISDLNFGKVPVNTERSGEVEIRNVGTVDVKLTAIDWPAPHNLFLRTEGLNFPIVIKPNDPPVKFNVFYNPGSTTGVLDKTRATFTVNTDEIKITSDWTGQGIDAGPYITGYDWKERRVLDAFAGVTEYTSQVKYGNSGNTADLENVTITPVGPDAKYFTVDLVTVFPRLGKNEEKTMNVSFKPEYINGTRDAERSYTLTLEMKGTFNGEVKTATSTLDGIGIQPHVDLTPSIDFGQTFKASAVSPNMNAVVTSNGTMNLTVSNKIKGIYIDGPDADKFIIDPAFIASNPYANTVAFNSGNNTMNIPIHFVANTEIRKFNAVLHIETDAPENPTCNLVAGTIETGTASLATTNVALKQFITLTRKGQVGITNTGSVDVTITDISSPTGAGAFFWKNLSKNNNTIAFPYILTIGSTLNVDVEYAPQIVNGIDDIATIEYTTGNGVFTSTLTGTPDQIISLVKIGKPNTTPWDSAYSVTAGELTDFIDFNLTNDESENLDRAFVKDFTASVGYLPSLVQPLLDKNNPIKNIQLTTLTNGWEVVSAEAKSIGNVGTLTVRMRSKSGTPLVGEGSLFRFRMASFLGIEKNSILSCQMKINDDPSVPAPGTNGYTLINNRPGKLWINLDCGKDIRTVRFGETGYSLSTVTPLPTGNHGTLDYSIGIDGQTNISIYNAMGQKVATLVDQQQKAGAYSVAFDTDGLQLSSGTYTCKIESGPYMDIQQIIIAK